MFTSRVLRSCLNLKRISNTGYRTIGSWHKPFLYSSPSLTSAINNKEFQNLQFLPSRQSGSFHLPYTLKHLEERVLLVLKLYDKINPDTITLDSHFYEDCGLDSLDHVEVIVAMEDEFDFEIPEEYHYRLMRPKDVVRYVADRFDIFE